jgi:Arc/MetJ-type ribon-helix-helix transcriptional regulator
MKVELTPDAAQWVEAELAAGRFATAADAVRHAVNQVKLAELRATLDAAEAAGGNSPPMRYADLPAVTSIVSGKIKRVKCHNSSIAQPHNAILPI